MPPRSAGAPPAERIPERRSGDRDRSPTPRPRRWLPPGPASRSPPACAFHLRSRSPAPERRRRRCWACPRGYRIPPRQFPEGVHRLTLEAGGKGPSHQIERQVVRRLELNDAEVLIDGEAIGPPEVDVERLSLDRSLVGFGEDFDQPEDEGRLQGRHQDDAI